MKQTLVILRGPAASGKTTICEKVRSYDRKIAWLSVDKFKAIFSDFEDRTLDDANKATIAELKYLLNEGFSVILDGIFKNTDYVYLAIEIAMGKNIPVVVYELKCSLKSLKERDKSRPGVKQGYRKPLGDEVIESLFNKIENNPINGAIELDTEHQSIDKCIEIINTVFNKSS